jgi:hypothetical protein
MTLILVTINQLLIEYITSTNHIGEAVVLKNPWFAEAKLQRIGEEGEEESSEVEW